jgi:hypothetical protein
VGVPLSCSSSRRFALFCPNPPEPNLDERRPNVFDGNRVQDGSRPIHQFNVLRGARQTATSAPQGSDEFEIEAPTSSKSFVVAQSFENLDVLEINSSESLVGSWFIFFTLMQAFVGGAFFNAQDDLPPATRKYPAIVTTHDPFVRDDSTLTSGTVPS